MTPHKQLISWPFPKNITSYELNIYDIYCSTSDKCRASLTFMESCEEDPEPALPAALICPQPHHAHRRHKHDIVGNRGAELILQVLHRTAAVVNGDKVTLALV